MKLQSTLEQRITTEKIVKILDTLESDRWAFCNNCLVIEKSFDLYLGQQEPEGNWVYLCIKCWRKNLKGFQK